MRHSSKDTKTTSSKSSHHSSRKRAEDFQRSDQGADVSSSFPGVQKPLNNTLSFLFVVNNLIINDNHEAGADGRGIWNPPLHCTSYSQEIVSPVFRYQDGRVTTLSNRQYRWHRELNGLDGVFSAGSIMGWTVDPVVNQYDWQTLPAFRTYTVFRGWHFQPVVFMGCDALTTDVNEAEMETMYHPLSFASDRRGDTVVSLVTAKRHLYAAGRNADWVGRLVPDSYRNPWRGSMPSGGLAGELSVILGLMGLSQPSRRAADAFTQQLWHDWRWRGPRWEFRTDPYDNPSPGPEDYPRGVLIHVCLDSIQNPAYSTAADLEDWERNGIIVRESSRSS